MRETKRAAPAEAVSKGANMWIYLINWKLGRNSYTHGKAYQSKQLAENVARRGAMAQKGWIGNVVPVYIGK